MGRSFRGRRNRGAAEFTTLWSQLFRGRASADHPAFCARVTVTACRARGRLSARRHRRRHPRVLAPRRMGCRMTQARPIRSACWIPAEGSQEETAPKILRPRLTAQRGSSAGPHVPARIGRAWGLAAAHWTLASSPLIPRNWPRPSALPSTMQSPLRLAVLSPRCERLTCGREALACQPL